MKLLKAIGYTLIYIILSISVISVLNYYNIINNNLFKIMKVLFLIIIFIINGYKISKISKIKNFVLLFCFILSLLLISINIICSKFDYKILIYITIICFSNLLGSFIYKKKKKA